MNEIQIFNSPDFGEVRTVVIDNEPWFVEKDISSILGYAKTFNMTKLIDKEDRQVISSSVLEEQVSKQAYQIGVVNESGLYAAIFGSKLESAKKFKKWVTSEVLPQLRKTGSYDLPTTTEGKIQLLAQGNVELNKKVDTLTERMDKLEMDLPLFPSEAEEVSNAAKRRGVEVLGGKRSAAYRNKSIRAKVFRTLYLYLNYSFGTKRYKEIKRGMMDKAVEIAETWTPPEFLAMEIAGENSQN